MYELNKEKFGNFLAALRKEKGYTQKDLAGKLFISDKAISKWERGLSMPDTSLLIPIAQIFDITVTELLCGEHLEDDIRLSIPDIDHIVSSTLDLSDQELKRSRLSKRSWVLLYLFSIFAGGLGLLVLFVFDRSIIKADLLTTLGLALLFGGWFCCGIKEMLPPYYDEYPIRGYFDGIFRLNLSFVRLNNSNWPYIVATGRIWAIVSLIAFPPLYHLIYSFTPDSLQHIIRFFPLISCLGIFIPMIILAIKYE